MVPLNRWATLQAKHQVNATVADTGVSRQTWQIGPPTRKRPHVRNVGRQGVVVTRSYALLANFPRSAFLNRDSAPLTLISRQMAA